MEGGEQVSDLAENDPATFVIEAVLAILMVVFAALETLFWVFGDSFMMRLMFSLSMLCLGMQAGWRINKRKGGNGN